MNRSSYMTLVVLITLSLVCAVVWAAALREDRTGELRVSFLDVGQGDSIFIESPTGVQVLIDGGPGNTVLRRLSSVMPWYDRSLDVVLGTHADLDHIGGLIELLPRYRVGTMLVPSTQGVSSAWSTYLDEIRVHERAGTRVFEALRGEHIDIGGGAYLEILFPDRRVSNLETNTGCVVTRLVYGSTAFMLPCDSPKEVERYLTLLGEDALKANVLKAGHHGSKTSSSPIFVGLVDPEYVVFSRGCDNTYGHPSPQAVETVRSFGIPVLDTCIDGTITFVSDGQRVARK